MSKNALKLEGGIVYEFDPEAVYEPGEGKSFKYISFKKVTSQKDGTRKYQNITVKIAHKDKFAQWLQECVDALRGNAKPGPDAPF